MFIYRESDGVEQAHEGYKTVEDGPDNVDTGHELPLCCPVKPKGVRVRNISFLTK